MTWFSWRQFRTSAWIAVVVVGVTGLLLAVSGRSLAAQWSSSGAATCSGDCSTAINEFMQQVTSGFNERIYQAALLLMYLAPPLIGIFWGAPLVARELEAGTHRLVWTQSVTRTRWIVIKLAAVGTASAATTGLLSWAVTAWSEHIDAAKDPRVTPAIYGARGIVPVGYALFAFALGVTLGMLIRRAVPAMAATLAIYVAAVVAMPLSIRAHLVPVVDSTPALALSQIQGFGISDPGGTLDIVVGASPTNGWVLTSHVITPTGQLFTGPPNPKYCSPTQGPQICLNWIGTLGLRQDITYQPASHFWALQWIETGVFVGLALLLAGFCVWWTGRRLT